MTAVDEETGRRIDEQDDNQEEYRGLEGGVPKQIIVIFLECERETFDPFEHFCEPVILLIDGAA